MDRLPIEVAKTQCLDAILKQPANTDIERAARSIVETIFKRFTPQQFGWEVAFPQPDDQREIMLELAHLPGSPEQRMQSIMNLLLRFYDSVLASMLDHIVESAGREHDSPVADDPEIFAVMRSARFRWLVLQTMNGFEVNESRGKVVCDALPETVDAIGQSEELRKTFKYVCSLFYKRDDDGGYRQKPLEAFRPHPGADEDAVTVAIAGTEELADYRSRCAEHALSAARAAMPAFRNGMTTDGLEPLTPDDRTDIRAFFQYMSVVVAEAQLLLSEREQSARLTPDPQGAVAVKTIDALGFSLAEGLTVEFLRTRFPDLLQIFTGKNPETLCELLQKQHDTFRALMEEIDGALAALARHDVGTLQALSGHRVMQTGSRMLTLLKFPVNNLGLFHAFVQNSIGIHTLTGRNIQEMPRIAMPETVVMNVFLSRVREEWHCVTSATTINPHEDPAIARGMQTVQRNFRQTEINKMGLTGTTTIYRNHARAGPALINVSCNGLPTMLPPDDAHLAFARRIYEDQQLDSVHVLSLASNGEFSNRLRDLAIAFHGTDKKLRYIINHEWNTGAGKAHAVMAMVVLPQADTMLLPLKWEPFDQEEIAMFRQLQLDIPPDALRAFIPLGGGRGDEEVTPPPPQEPVGTRVRPDPSLVTV